MSRPHRDPRLRLLRVKLDAAQHGQFSCRELEVLHESNVYQPPPMETGITPMLSAVSSSSPFRLYGKLPSSVGRCGEKPTGADAATAP
jgi:hypothetical protein